MCCALKELARSSPTLNQSTLPMCCFAWAKGWFLCHPSRCPVCVCMCVWAGRDFVARLLAKNPKERISAKDALEHPWM